MNTTSVTDSPDSGRHSRRKSRFDALRVLWRESSLDRVRSCKHHGVLPTGSVVVKAQGAGSERRAGFSGLATCGSVWACPVCSHKIAASRSDEIAAAIGQWTQLENGRRVAHLTLTMRHRNGDTLRHLWDALSDSWQAVTSGRGWREDQARYGVPLPRMVKSGRRAGQTVVEDRLPFIRAVEATHGVNGWHLHIHAVLLLGPVNTDTGAPLDDLDVQSLGYSMFRRWLRGLSRKGMTASVAHGYKIQLMTGDVSQVLGDYFTKQTYRPVEPAKALAMETTLGQHKSARFGNRTPFEVLRGLVAVQNGESLDYDSATRDLAIWREWETASKGRRQLTWSTGLRDLLALGEDASDQELAEAEIEGHALVVLDAGQWAAVRTQAAQLLAAAEADDTGHALNDLLVRLLT